MKNVNERERERRRGRGRECFDFNMTTKITKMVSIFDSINKRMFNDKILLEMLSKSMKLILNK